MLKKKDFKRDRRVKFREEGPCTVLDHLMTAGQVADLLGVGRLTVSLWTHRLGLPRVEIPGDKRSAVRYDRAEVIRWAKREGKRIHLVGSNANHNGKASIA